MGSHGRCPWKSELEHGSAAGLEPRLLTARSAPGMIFQVLGDCDLISGSLLLKGEHFILLFTPRAMKVQSWWQGLGTALPTHARLSCLLSPSGLELSNPVAVAFSFIFHIILFVFSLLFPFSPHSSRAIQFTDGRYWICSPRQHRFRTTWLSSGSVSEHASS